MNQIRMTQATRRLVAAVLAAPLFALGACGSDPVVVAMAEDNRYLEEQFEATVESDVQYGVAMDENGAEEALLLDLYQPTGDPLPLRPAVIWLHGGSFQFGHKGEMTDFAHSSARRGFVSVSANYRLRENVVFDYTDPDDQVGEEAKHDAQHDVKAAVRWLRANADELRIDPKLIFLAGFSAGATAALRVGASPDDPGSSGNPGLSSSVTGVVAIAASIEEGMLAAATGPTLLIHGTADTKVSFARVEEACAAVDRCELVPIEGGVHNLIDSAKDEIISATARFLRAEVTP